MAEYQQNYLLLFFPNDDRIFFNIQNFFRELKLVTKSNSQCISCKWIIIIYKNKKVLIYKK
jgi:hypothetical protein